MKGSVNKKTWHSGASFKACGFFAGYLVVFGRSKEAKKAPDFTPK